MTDLDLEMMKVAGARFLSVYGAMIALQVRDWMREGREAPGTKEMLRFVQEARAVAQLSEDVQR